MLLTPGTKETDNVCGPPSTAPIYFSSSPVSTPTLLGPALAVLVQEPMTSSSTPSSSLTGPGLKGERHCLFFANSDVGNFGFFAFILC